RHTSCLSTGVQTCALPISLLEYLMRNAGRDVTRSMILEHVWNLSFDTTTNVVDVYINYLRRKIDDGHPVKLIHTVRGIGYGLSRSEERRVGKVGRARLTEV